MLKLKPYLKDALVIKMNTFCFLNLCSLITGKIKKEGKKIKHREYVITVRNKTLVEHSRLSRPLSGSGTRSLLKRGVRLWEVKNPVFV